MTVSLNNIDFKRKENGLETSVLRQVNAMHRYALSNGLNPPDDLLHTIESYNSTFLSTEVDLKALSSEDNGPLNSGESERNMHENPIKVTANAKAQDYKVLAECHRRLSRLLSPATPGTIEFLEKEKEKNSSIIRLLGPVPLVRQLSFFAILFLIGVVAVGSSGEINPANLQKGILESNGITAIMTVMFLLCCSGLGASFNSLFLVNQYIANATYDSKYDSTYLTRIILGLIAGLIIVELIPQSLLQGHGQSTFTKPALAVISGYSANLVYQILQRFSDTIESLVKGDPKKVSEFGEETQKAKLEEQRIGLHSSIASQLLAVQANLNNAQDSEKAKDALNGVIKDLLPDQRK